MKILSEKFWIASTPIKMKRLLPKTHMNLKKFKEVVTIIAPVLKEQMKSCIYLTNLIKVQILNKNENIINDKEIVIINYFGDLLSFYKFSKVFYRKINAKKT